MNCVSTGDLLLIAAPFDYAIAVLTALSFAALAVAYAVVWGSGSLPRYEALGLPFLVLAYWHLNPRTPSRLRMSLVSLAGVSFAVAGYMHLARTGMEGRAALVGPFNPWSDAHDYLSDAMRLVHGEPFTGFGVKRPTYPLVLAALLRGFYLDVRVPILILAGASGLALGPAVERFRRHLGLPAAALLLLLTLTALRRFGSVIGSEALALPLMLVGATALAPCVHSTTFSRGGAVLAVVAFTLAQATRPGALLALPALVLALAMLAPKPERRVVAVTLTTALLVAWSIPSLLGKTLGDGVPFVDYPAIFFGMLRGEDFTILTAEHPELLSMDPGLRPAATVAIIGATLARAPWLLPIGLVRAIGAFFVTPHGLFSLAWTCSDDHVLEGPLARKAIEERGLNGAVHLWVDTLGSWSLVNTVVAALVAAAVSAYLIRLFFLAFRDARLSLLGHVKAVVALALAVSPGFTPVWITEGTQLSLATLPLLALLAAEQTATQPVSSEPRTSDRSWNTFSLLALLFVFPILRAGLALAPLAAPACSNDETRFVRLPSTATTIGGDDTQTFGTLSVKTYLVQRSFLERHFEELTMVLDDHVREGTIVATAYDACRKETRLTLTEPLGSALVMTPARHDGIAPDPRVVVTGR